jgi:hypothetical protein
MSACASTYLPGFGIAQCLFALVEGKSVEARWQWLESQFGGYPSDSLRACFKNCHTVPAHLGFSEGLERVMQAAFRIA